MRAIPYLIATLVFVGNQNFVLAKDQTTVSPDRSLTMTHNHESGCSTGKINGTYTTKFDVSGVLYQVDCNNQGDAATFFFMDTQGTERCYGKMIEGWGGRGGDSTEWYIRGAVPGYQCNSVGKTFQQNGMRTKQ